MMTPDSALSVADPIDEYAGHGGSYELLPDGTRKLIFRTGMEIADTVPASDEPGDLPAPRTKRQD